MAAYQADLYEINFFMISLILEKIYGLVNNEDYKHKNYTIVVSKPQEHLVKNIKQNIDCYMDIMLDNCDAVITDNENVALEIINNLDISNDHKITYINYLRTPIDKIDSVEDHKLWSELLNQKIIRYSENNILKYYFNSDLDGTLVKFINENDDGLSFNYEDIKENYGLNETVKFYNDIILCENLLDKRFEAIIQSYNSYYDAFDYEGLSEAKVDILIRLKKISMNEANLLFMRDNYPDQVVNFICTNIELYVENVTTMNNFLYAELISLLDEKFDDSFKLDLLKFTSKPISVKGKKYSENINLYILKNNLDTNDIPNLIRSYNQVSSSLSDSILLICIENMNQIVREEYEIPYELLIKLVGLHNIDQQKKSEILLLNLGALNEKQAVSCLELLGMSEVISLFSGKWPKLEKNNYNMKLLEIFEKKGWISGFDVDKHEKTYYRARGRKYFII
ncbi:hypothetical protein [Paenibacillus macerans]|uniref:hypothetical protein n=1 Tax=Paenibacillus macerans TaxID=44252 RepID=UPI003D311AF2